MKKTFLGWLSSIGQKKVEPIEEPKKEVVRVKPPCICQEIWKAQASGFCGACRRSWA